jgi:hypothetical protein
MLLHHYFLCPPIYSSYAVRFANAQGPSVQYFTSKRRVLGTDPWLVAQTSTLPQPRHR